MSLNRVVLVGRLTRNPELRTSGGGTAICNFSMAVNRIRKSEDQDADFFNIVCFGKTAEFVSQYLQKGRLASVDGRLQQRKYTTKDGQARDVVEILADNVQGLDRAPDSADRRSEEQRPGWPPAIVAVPADQDYDPFSDPEDPFW